jgi:hypothetical protein
MTDRDAGDIRDRIERTGLPVEGNAEIAGTRRGGAGGFDCND